MATLVILAVGVFFLGMGLYALIAPAALVRPFHLGAGTPEGRSEVRAVYGGFGVAVAAVLGATAFGAGSVRPGVVLTVGAALGGMALGRVVSRLAEGRAAPSACYPVWFYCAVEAGAAVLLLTLAR
ncbi:uncharacterized protein DUF4345 [Prauserella shujinwangii]|uniref:Uncharacterized protein DUF4345 n=1 Tax=Prauserella shujinwangii TaxID=1453103 RepID=A0A2T0M374_9PSEU|nr:DUF4345 family protein [Prauserella shujinwangii]PRX51159.1 uncharacterized protein DUF4345 [Prauserella shujinwangii]